MPVVALDYVAAGAGHVSLIDYDGEVSTLDLPEGVYPLLERPSFAESLRSESRLYIEGGLNDNCMVTDQRVLLRQFIAPVSRPMIEDTTPEDWQIGVEIVNGLVGLTGDCIFFLRWYDSVNKRRSPFSAGSPTLTLDGTQGVKFYNVPSGPSPADAGVDQIEIWVNRNGLLDPQGRILIQRLAYRTLGAATFQITENIEYEAEEEYGLSRMPRCRFNEIYRERKWSSGDTEHPERIYFSPLTRMAEYTTDSYLETLEGEPVTGLVRVRNVLVVLCPHSSYYISGYSETDFEVVSLEPSIGAITHHGIKKIHDIAIIPSHQGLYACTGTSMRLLDGDYATTWTEKYNANPLGFERGFGITDTRAKVYKFYEENVSVTDGVPTYDVGRFWVFDYKNFSEEDGGSFTAPYLSFDRYQQRAKCAAMVAPPRISVCELLPGFLQSEPGPRREQLGGPRHHRLEGDEAPDPGDQVRAGGWTERRSEVHRRVDVRLRPELRQLATGDAPRARSGFDPRPLFVDHGADYRGLPWECRGRTVVPGWAGWAWTYEIATLTRVGAIATATTVKNHNLSTGDVRTISGAVEVDYNGSFPITVTGPKTFEYTVGGLPTSPATGTILVTGQVGTFSPDAIPFRIELSGEGLSLMLTITDPIGLIWSGYGFTSTAGKKLQMPSQ